MTSRGDICTVGDAAVLLGIHRNGVHYLVREGNLTVFRATLRGWLLFRYDDVMATRAKREVRAARRLHPALRLVDRQPRIDARGQLELPMAGGVFVRRRQKGELPSRAARMAKVPVCRRTPKPRETRKHSRSVA